MLFTKLGIFFRLVNFSSFSEWCKNPLAVKFDQVAVSDFLPAVSDFLPAEKKFLLGDLFLALGVVFVTSCILATCKMLKNGLLFSFLSPKSFFADWSICRILLFVRSIRNRIFLASLGRNQMRGMEVFATERARTIRETSERICFWPFPFFRKRPPAVQPCLFRIHLRSHGRNDRCVESFIRQDGASESRKIGHFDIMIKFLPLYA